MKKIILTAAACICTAASVYAQDVGDVIGTVYTTDIITLVDSVPIPSYSIGGTTAIALSDLREYGFDVQFNEETRRVDVTTLTKPENITGIETKRGTVGGVCGNVLYTDIRAYVNGVEITSFNVEGRTCVRVEDLGALTDEYNVQWGYSDYNFNYRYDDSVRTLYLNSYRFPKVSMGEVSVEMKGISANNELELYTKGDTQMYYGARLEPQKGIYAGINGDGTDGFKTSFGVYSTYFEFDERMDYFCKPNINIISQSDCINLIPWNTSAVGSAFENEEYIRRTLDNIASSGKKSIIRYAAEMNVGTMGNSPSAYVKAFRYIADIVHEYDNMAMMWSPNDFGSLDRPYEIYYPGDEYVDWIGISSFMKHDFMGNVNTDEWGNLAFNCGKYAWTSNSLKKISAFMEKNNINKPIAISEGAVESEIYYSEIDIHDWAIPRLRAMYWNTAMKFPQVKLITYFNQYCGGEVMSYKLTDEYRAIIEEALECGIFLTTASDSADMTFVKAQEQVYNNTLPLYTYAYFPHNDIERVEYYIDTALAASADEIPYAVNMDISALEKNTHTLTVKAVSAEEIFEYSYELYFDGAWKIK